MNARRLVLLAVILLPASLVACSSDSAPETAADDSASADAASTAPSVIANNAFYYYADVDAAWRFYTDVLGFETVVDYGFAKILRVASTSYLTLVDAAEGMHSADEPKTVTMAFVTDELESWYEYLQGAGVTMHSPFEPTEGRPHSGFVAVDPEGYYLEFERFDPHPENERLLPLLEQLEPLRANPAAGTSAPLELSIRATVMWLYYQDTAPINAFYHDLFGANAAVDQGWAWAYQSSPSGFVGIVDSARGLHQETEDKGVTASFFVDDIGQWFAYAKTVSGLEFRNEEIGDESGRVAVFVAYDPAGYFLEWDEFLDVEGNEKLLPLLRQ